MNTHQRLIADHPRIFGCPYTLRTFLRYLSRHCDTIATDLPTDSPESYRVWTQFADRLRATAKEVLPYEHDRPTSPPRT